jgi:S-adenosylmethionine decarboxylase proenzyme
VIEPERRHVVADVVGADDERLLRELLTRSATAAGATVLGAQSHHFEPEGVTVLVMLAESHVSIHTWPERGAAFVDAFTCGSVSPWHVVGPIVEALGGAARTASVTAAA